MLNSVELFVGAGGLGMGLELVPVPAQGRLGTGSLVLRHHSREPGRSNPLVSGWPLHECDVRQFDYGSLAGGIDLVSGGPPCQPFSMGGKHGGCLDHRDMFPSTVDVVRRLSPRAFMVENVRGLTRPAFTNYFQYVLLQFEFPEIMARADETWGEHLARLEKEKTSGRRSGLTYDVVHRVLNAADFGIPQKRERVFIVGFRGDLEVDWSFPDKTHSHDALRVSQWITGEYWDRPPNTGTSATVPERAGASLDRKGPTPER